MKSSNSVIDFVRIITKSKVGLLIETQVLEKIREQKNQTKITYDITDSKDIKNLLYIPVIRSNIDCELSWKYALEIIVKGLKKKFIDSNIYYKNKEILDIHDNVTIHRLIIVDWS
jgi:hypothetical protein